MCRASSERGKSPLPDDAVETNCAPIKNVNATGATNAPIAYSRKRLRNNRYAATAISALKLSAKCSDSTGHTCDNKLAVTTCAACQIAPAPSMRGAHDARI